MGSTAIELFKDELWPSIGLTEIPGTHWRLLPCIYFRNEIHWKEGHLHTELISLKEKIRTIVSTFFNLLCLPGAAVYDFARFVVTFPYYLVAAAFRQLQKNEDPTPQEKLEEGIVPTYVNGAYETYLNTPNASMAFPSTVKFIGIADSFQQTNGIGQDSAVPLFRNAESQWTRFNDQPGTIEGITSPRQLKSFYVDHITNPAPFIKYLKHIGANSYRFPIEWSVVQKADGSYDEEAIALYRTFIQKLKKAGIEPLITLHHFVHPQWFEDKGGFTKLENVDLFVKHALEMIQRFPEVDYWMTFNELGVHAFSSYIFGSHPPGKSGHFGTAAEVLRNLCIAHCKIFKEAQDQPLSRQPKIGLTHQWLDFTPLEGSGNILERGLCKLFGDAAHKAVLNFLTTGEFELDGCIFKISKEEWKKYNGFLDFMGIQWYGYPRLKMGWNNLTPRPGYKITNLFGFTFGATCPPGGAAQAFGPSFYPKSLRTTLQAAAKIKKPLMITEIGGDCINWECGKEGFENTERSDKIRAIFSVGAIPSILQDYARSPESLEAPLIGVQYWTWIKERQQEWDRGFGNTCLGIADVEVDHRRRVVAVKDTPTSTLLAKVFQATKAQLGAASAA